MGDSYLKPMDGSVHASCQCTLVGEKMKYCIDYKVPENQLLTLYWFQFTVVLRTDSKEGESPATRKRVHWWFLLTPL